jgi:hypothetical protein
MSTESKVVDFLENFTIEFSETAADTSSSKKYTKVAKVAKPEEPKIPKERFNALISVDIIEKLRDVAFAYPEVSMTSLAEEGLTMVLEKFYSEHGGQPKKREGDLKVGRKKKKLT